MAAKNNVIYGTKSFTNKAKSKITEKEFIYETTVERAENKSLEMFCKLSKKDIDKTNLTIQYTSKINTCLKALNNTQSRLSLWDYQIRRLILQNQRYELQDYKYQQQT